MKEWRYQPETETVRRFQMKEFFEKFTKKWYSFVFWIFLLTNQLGPAAAILLFYVLDNDDL